MAFNWKKAKNHRSFDYCLEGKTFLSRKLSLFTREQAEEMVEKHGGKNISAVSKNPTIWWLEKRREANSKSARHRYDYDFLDEQQFWI